MANYLSIIRKLSRRIREFLQCTLKIHVLTVYSLLPSTGDVFTLYIVQYPHEWQYTSSLISISVSDLAIPEVDQPGYGPGRGVEDPGHQGDGTRPQGQTLVLPTPRQNRTKI